MKVCPSCKNEYALDFFNSQKKYCKPCHYEKGKQWREANKEKDRISKTQYHKRKREADGKPYRPHNSNRLPKEEILGMAWGTAAHRLRKEVMFSLVKKCGEDVCFRCGNKIETALDLSLDHMEDWENVDVALFWNVDNITFSHRKCNTKSAGFRK